MITVLIYIPKTKAEEIYLTFIMIVNCGVFGFSLNERKIFLTYYY